MENDAVYRSERFVLSYQLDGMCQALRLIIQLKEKPGVKTLQLLTKLRSEVGRNVTGQALKDVPDFDATTTLPELVAIAEFLRATMVAFLSPEETKERSGSMGFSPTASKSGAP
jgi:hypothetical protein